MAADPEAQLQKLLPLHTAVDFEALIAGDPGMLTPEVVAALRGADPLPGMGRIFASAADLLEEARSDPQGAWTVYEGAMADSRQEGDRLAEEALEIEHALTEGHHAEVLERVEEPLALADRSGSVEVCAVLLRQRAKALWAIEGPDRIENQERALVDLTASATAVLGTDPLVSALGALELGAASLERIEWDRTWNLEHGLAMIRLAAKTLRGTDFEEMLDFHLVEALILQVSGDLMAHVREAEGLARAMVAAAPFGDDCVDWAAKQLLLARTLKRGVEIGESDNADAEAAFEAILSRPDGIRSPRLLGRAGSELGQLLLRSTDDDPDSAFEELVAWLIPREEEAEERETLNRAREHFEAALDRLRGTSGFEFAIAVASLAEVLQRLGDSERAIAKNREALALLTPRIHPERVRPCAQRLGEMLGDRGEWDEAAAAYEVGIEAAEIVYGRRQSSAGRAREAMLALGLTRRAAFAVARAGDPERAIKLLESSRNREFRRHLAEAGSGELAERETDFESAVEAGPPVFYLNPSPWGTVLLVVSSTDERACFEAVFLDRPVGMEVYRHLLMGDAAAATDPEELLTRLGGSYLYGASVLGESGPLSGRQRRRREKLLRAGLDELLPWLGEGIGTAIDEVCSRLGADTVTLIPCGILALAPLHAATWETDEGFGCLLDRLVVRYSPSALVAGIAAERASGWQVLPHRLLGLADPRGDLGGARAELGAIAARFDPDHRVLARGPEATVAFLRNHLSDATHLHLACHATASVDWRETGVRLADDFLPASELEALGSWASAWSSSRPVKERRRRRPCAPRRRSRSPRPCLRPGAPARSVPSGRWETKRPRC